MPPDPAFDDRAFEDLATTDTTWDEIDRLLDEASRLSKLDVAPREFHAQLLQQAVTALAASGGAIWTVGHTGLLEPSAQIDYPRWQLATGPGAATDTEAQHRHRALLEEVIQRGEARAVESFSLADNVDPAGNSNDALLLLAPAMLDGQPVALLEIIQRADTPAAARLGYVRLAQALADLLADFDRNRQWRQLRDRAALASDFDRLADEVHRTLDPQAVAYAVANEGRRIIGCDRLSVAAAEGSTCRLLAVSGLDTFDRRSTVVQRLETLVAAALLQDVHQGGDRVTLADDARHVPVEVEQPLEAYLDAAHARLLMVIPLYRTEAVEPSTTPRRAIGALVVERYDTGTLGDAMSHRIDAVARHAALALGNALAHRAVPMVATLERLGRAAWYVRARGWPKLVWIAAAVAALVAALVFVPADFELEARGELQPRERRDVFAPCDAIVKEIQVNHASDVTAGQVLLTLRRPELEVELSRVLGEMQTARKKLSAIQAARVTNLSSEADRRNRQNQLTAEEEEVKQLQANLEAELKLLRAQEAELQVSAPLDGVVATWDVERLLAARPVARGQRLLSVARTAGPWVLEVQLPDNDVGHLLAAQAEQPTDLQVSYILATDPAATYNGHVTRVAMNAEPDEKQGSHVLVTVDVASDELAAERRRPGATVIARVACGRRSIGYVWFHELYAAVRKRIWF